MTASGEQAGVVTEGGGATVEAVPIFISARARSMLFGLYGAGLLVFVYLTWASLFSGDQHNTIYYVTGAVAALFLYRLISEVRKYFGRTPEVLINADGFKINYPSELFWAWPRIKEARADGRTVVIDLHPMAGIDQGVFNRTDVIVKTGKLDLPADEIARLVNAGVRAYGAR